MHPKYIATMNSARITQLSSDLNKASNREDWSEVVDLAQRIAKLAGECEELGHEEVRKQWEE